VVSLAAALLPLALSLGSRSVIGRPRRNPEPLPGQVSHPLGRLTDIHAEGNPGSDQQPAQPFELVFRQGVHRIDKHRHDPRRRRHVPQVQATRDWAVKNRAFVFDLSPWGDEKPLDDPDQRLGLDLETYRLVLAETLRQSAGRCMTELTGFVAFSKYSHMPDHPSAHEPVPTEWETVWLMSPYNCYQNTISSDCFNQSLHSQAPRRPLEQRRAAKPVQLENKAYLCVLMADYDSATPLYEFLPNHWHNAARGQIPLAWGINPNLLETYPDLIAYFYSTASPADTFTSDASAAGYMNPNRIRPEHLPLFVQHNQRFFREADMTLAPMVLDWDQPSPAVKDAFRQFAPDGFATIVMDLHGTGGKLPEPHVWKRMPVLELINNACNFAGAEPTADILSRAIADRGNRTPGFYLFRIVWVNPTNIAETLAALRRKRPELDFEVVAPHAFFALFRQFHERQSPPGRPPSRSP